MKPAIVKTLSAVLFVAFGPGMVKAQSYHHLIVSDYLDKPQSTGNMIAYTSCFVDLHTAVSRVGEQYRFTFVTEVTLNKERSWIDLSRMTSSKMLAEVLDHEQGHYNIAWLERRELQAVLDRAHFDGNYKAEVSAIFDHVHAKYAQLTLDYDDDTHFSLNEAQQRSWDKYFQREFTRYYASVKR
ncbi:MAG: hypothetical protein JST19_07630 [Bacteroidetes bacterium]|nr:hypothetical protein [Bacteroidota bacterium]